jgi:hypothetical protein
MPDDVTRDGAPRAGEPSAARKPYRRPTIVRYGDVTTLTRSGSIGSKNDKGSGSKTRTT